jgi:hypothetical protein
MAAQARTWTIRGRTYENRVIPTADLQPGQRISAPGVGLWATILDVDHRGDLDDVTEVTYEYRYNGELRRALRRRRKTSGKTTIHVLVDGDVPMAEGSQ